MESPIASAKKTSLATLGSGESPIADIWQFLRQFDWDSISFNELNEFLHNPNSQAICAIVIDGAAFDVANCIASIRRLPHPLGSVPILVCGGDPELPIGSGGHFSAPVDENEFLALLREWAGPLDDHALRADFDNPRYRLIRLVGLTRAEAMIRDFRTSLQQAIDAAKTDPIPAHNFAGLAGMLGFAELSKLWAAAESGDENALARAIETSRVALSQVGSH